MNKNILKSTLLFSADKNDSSGGIAFHWLNFCAKILLLMICLVLSSNVIFANSTDIDTKKVKFIYYFTKFISWPESRFTQPSDPLVICYYGDNNISGQLLSLSSKQVKNHPIKILSVTNKDALKSCHILYIAEAKQNDLADILKTSINHHILTIGEASDFALNKGIIKFYLNDGIVQFEVNAVRAKQARIKISSKLLVSAKIVGQFKIDTKKAMRLYRKGLVAMHKGQCELANQSFITALRYDPRDNTRLRWWGSRTAAYLPNTKLQEMDKTCHLSASR